MAVINAAPEKQSTTPPPLMLGGYAALAESAWMGGCTGIRQTCWRRYAPRPPVPAQGQAFPVYHSSGCVQRALAC